MIIGLPFNTYTGHIYNNEEEILNNLSNIDGCFQINLNKKIITDTNCYFPTYYDIENKKIINNSITSFYKCKYIEVPNYSVFSYQNDLPSVDYYLKIDDIKENIFLYFEKWFLKIYSSIIEKYPNTYLSLSSGIDSKYLLAILKYYNLPYKLITWDTEGKIVKKYFNECKYIEVKNSKEKINYLQYYIKNNYLLWNKEYYTYVYYSKLENLKVDVIIEGLGRNYFCSKPRINDSPDIYKIKRTFSCGRYPILIKNNLKAFYPYSCKNIRWNLRKMNLSEYDLVKEMYNRIEFLFPDLNKIYTNSFEKAKKYDDEIHKELLFFTSNK